MVKVTEQHAVNARPQAAKLHAQRNGALPQVTGIPIQRTVTVNISRYTFGSATHHYQVPNLRIGGVNPRFPRKTEVVCIINDVRFWAERIQISDMLFRPFHICLAATDIFQLSQQHDMTSSDEQEWILAARCSDRRQQHGTEFAKLCTELREERNLHL